MTGRSAQFIPVYDKRDLGQAMSRELLFLFRCGCTAHCQSSTILMRLAGN